MNLNKIYVEMENLDMSFKYYSFEELTQINPNIQKNHYKNIHIMKFN